MPRFKKLSDNKMIDPETKAKDAERVEEKVIVITDEEVREYRKMRPHFNDKEIRSILKRQHQDRYRKRQ